MKQGDKPLISGRKIWLISLAVSAGTIAILLNIADTSLITERLQNADLIFIGLFIILDFCVGLCRAVRLWLLLRITQSTNMIACLRLTLIHQAVFVIAPSGSGDLAFPILGKMITKSNIKEAISVLISLRLQDLSILIGIAGFACFYIFDLKLPVNDLVVAICWLTTGFILTIYATKLNNWIGKLLIYIKKMFDTIRKASPAKDQYKSTQNNASLPQIEIYLSTLMTLLSWVLTGVMVWSLFMGFNVELSWQMVFYIVAGLNLVGALAIATIGGLGITELGLAGLLITLSIPGSVAVPIAMVARPTLLVTTILFGLTALIGVERNSTSPNRNSK